MEVAFEQKPSRFKINKKFLPIKAHYFFFLGCVSPILPFMIVVARQLGIPVYVQGIVGSVILLLTVIIKPIIASAADYFSKVRKAIFLLILTLMVSSYFAIIFLPQMHNHGNILISGRIVTEEELLRNREEPNLANEFSISTDSKFYFVSNEEANNTCHPEDLWDCSSEENSEGNKVVVPHLLLLNNPRIFEALNTSDFDHKLIYHSENAKISSSDFELQINLTCKGGLYVGKGCRSLWSTPLFYLYLTLLSLGYISFSIGNSVSDAICVDLIGKDGDFGNQRAWGTVGWGLMGPVSGLLIDWYTGESYMKNYLPAFLILFALGSFDILLSAWKLEVPRMEQTDDLWKSVGVIMKKRSFILFLLFVILAGSFDGVVASFIFVMQEDMAQNTYYMRHMKFIQGMTIGVQCFFEAPFMWVCDWFLKKMGSSALLSFVFFLYIFRLFGLALVGSYGPVWATLLVEILNGPCYGLGYTAIVNLASLSTLPGTSTTVQSITNLCYESLGYALASFIGGILFSVVGGPGIYYVFGCISVLTFILHLFSIHWEKKENRESLKLKKPEDEPLKPPPASPTEVELSVNPSDVFFD